MQVSTNSEPTKKFSELVGGQGFRTKTNNLYVKLDTPIVGYNSIRVKHDNGYFCFEAYGVLEDLDVYPCILTIVTN